MPMRLTVITCVLLLYFALANAATLPSGFTETQIAGLSNPTAFELAPDGRLFVCQQGGQLRVIKNGALLPTPFLTVSVDSDGERGLLGVAFDPNFQTNHFIYIYYTTSTSPRHNRVSRFTANGDVAVAGSEVAILDLENLSSATNHNGGAIHFGPDGKLYIAVGDNANGANSQTLSNRLGKMLRINTDGTIPSDNPFFNTATGVNRSIWALGLRNPFTFAFQPGTTRMFINDVGQNTWEEINDGIAGSNYGWPNTEGSTNDPNFRSPLLSYGHGFGSTTGCAIAGGAFYNPAVVQFPSSYVGKYFFADLCSGWIRVMNPANNTADAFAASISQPVDLKVSNDGSLYYLARGSSSVFRVQFTPPSETPPTVTAHPANQTVLAGQAATFSVTATGSAPLSYQWQREGANIPGATANSYTTAPTTLSDNGSRYRCIVSNAFGSATSNEAVLTVNAPPAITSNPSSQTVAQGATATFSVSATGSASLSYQWQREGSNIPGATASSYTTAPTTLSDTGSRYRCIVSNAFGSATSNEAVLTVNAPPAITSDPSSQTVAQGATATFSVSATGSAPLSYQWQRDGANIPGATANSYTTAPTTLSDTGSRYRCIVSNAFGSATSSEAVLTVNASPAITSDPSSQTVAQGATATFSVTATGSGPLSYQWQRDGANIPGATAASHTTAETSFADNGAKFRCVVSNAFGSAISNEAVLTVNSAPTITSGPSSQSVVQGASATFSVTSTGSAPLSYQWQRDGANIPGANANSYTTAPTTLSDSGSRYRCIVSNAFGSATSGEATLTVSPPGPVLLTEEDSDRAIALNVATQTRDPFELFTEYNFSSDHQTRVSLFVLNGDLHAGETIAAITVQAEDPDFAVHLLPVEFSERVPGFDWLTQVVVRLPETLPRGREYLVTLSLHGKTSNKARIRIQ